MMPVRLALVLTLTGSLAAGRLGGLLPCSEQDVVRWPWCGTWIYPVGRDDDFQARPESGSAYELLRGFGGTGHREGHQGADLGCGHTGGWVRAAAHGIVVQSVAHDTTTAYGCRIVIAHRLAEGGVAYSVYAHLLPGSARVRAGQRVAAGERIARVGESGNATAPHLHFEVRTAEDLCARWEKTRAVDPLAFVTAHLGSAGIARDPAPIASLQRWAEQSALVPPGLGPAQPLDRSRWRAMLACAARRAPPSGVASEALGSALPARAAHDTVAAADLVTWPELEHELARLGADGVRVPPAVTRVRADSTTRRATSPTVMDAVRRLAALAAPPSRAKRLAGKHGSSHTTRLAAKHGASHPPRPAGKPGSSRVTRVAKGASHRLPAAAPGDSSRGGRSGS